MQHSSGRPASHRGRSRRPNPPAPPRPLTVSFVSLGCPKNLVDSEKMLGLLAEHGVVPTADEADADVIVINTCGFLEASKQESLAAIRQAAAKRGRARRIVVAGCLATRLGRQILDEVPGIDALVGVNQREDIVAAVVGQPPGRSGAKTGPAVYLGRYHPHAEIDTARLRLTPRHYAYLRISEGCNRGCSFCTIPAIRGPMRSKPMAAVEAEARELIADGTLELNLIGQDTTAYGAEQGSSPGGRWSVDGLARLLERLDRLEGACWIRVLYAYPSGLTGRLIDAIASAEHVLPYVDLPLQHINDRILKRMRRRDSRRRIEALLARLRERIPAVTIRTTFITGFPGETEAEHRELLAFIENFRFDMLGVFGYSQEPSTPAGRMGGQVPEDVKQARRAELMAAQQQIVLRRNGSLIGKAASVLVDRVDRNGRPVGRTTGQAPEVDSVTYLSCGRPAKVRPGQLLPARIVGFEGYDLIAEPTGGPIAQSPDRPQAMFPIYQPMGDAPATER